MNYDFLNSVFEFGGALLALFNLKSLHRDKVVQGIHPVTVAFSALWAIQCLPYYLSNDDHLSFSGACCRSFVIVAWCIYYAFIRWAGKRELSS